MIAFLIFMLVLDYAALFFIGWLNKHGINLGTFLSILKNGKWSIYWFIWDIEPGLQCAFYDCYHICLNLKFVNIQVSGM